MDGDSVLCILFSFLGWSVDWFSIPRYILPKPSTIVVNASADLPRLIDYTYITGLETILGYLTAIVIAIPLGSVSYTHLTLPTSDLV